MFCLVFKSQLHISKPDRGKNGTFITEAKPYPITITFLLIANFPDSIQK